MICFLDFNKRYSLMKLLHACKLWVLFHYISVLVGAQGRTACFSRFLCNTRLCIWNWPAGRCNYMSGMRGIATLVQHSCCSHYNINIYVFTSHLTSDDLQLSPAHLWWFIVMISSFISGACWTERTQILTASVRAWTLTRSPNHSPHHFQVLRSATPTPVPQKPIPRIQPAPPTFPPLHHPCRHLHKHLWTSARFFWTLKLAVGGTSDHGRYPITPWVETCLAEDLGILAGQCRD